MGHITLKAKGFGRVEEVGDQPHCYMKFFFTEPWVLQFSLNNALHVCKSVIYHSFAALFHLEIFKKGLAGHLFLYLKVALMNNKVLLNLSDVRMWCFISHSCQQFVLKIKTSEARFVLPYSK